MATVYSQVGEEQVTDFTTGAASAPANYFVAWGTDGTTASKSDTSLNAEGAESRDTATVDQPVADQMQAVGTITATSGKTIQEAGLFDAASGGNLFIRGDFAGIRVETDDSIEFTFTLEQT